MKKISIINLEHTTKGNYINACKHAFDELEIESLLKIKPQYISGNMMKFKPIDFFVADLPTICHRLDIFEDLLEFKEIYNLFIDILPIICGLREMDKRKEEPYNFIEYIYSIRELSLYTDCIVKFHDTLFALEEKVKSTGLKHLITYIKTIFESEEFQNLQTNLKSMDFRLKPIKSITVGVNLNLNANDQIIGDIGILSINQQRIKSGKSIISRVLRETELEQPDQFLAAVDTIFKPSLETAILNGVNIQRRSQEIQQGTITPTSPIFKGLDAQTKEALNLNFKKAINTALKRTLKNVDYEIFDYVKKNTTFLADLLPELSFLIAGVDFINKMQGLNIAICKPQVSEDSYSAIKNLKNPHLLTTMKSEEIRENDVSFDNDGMIYVLTGANSGGKSIFLQSVGIAQVLFQLGLYVPATDATLSTSEHLCVHFPSKVAIEVDGGRLEQECKMISKVIKEASSTSFVLMDETFSSTSAYDASILAEATLKHLASIGCKGIFSTHIHNLDQAIDEINEHEKTIVKVDSLLAVTEAGNRSYRVVRGRSEGHSHAKDIAQKYGLLFD